MKTDIYFRFSPNPYRIGQPFFMKSYSEKDPIVLAKAILEHCLNPLKENKHFAETYKL
jgi:hypothetical protein